MMSGLTASGAGGAEDRGPAIARDVDRLGAGAAPALRRGLAVLRLLGSRAVPVSAGAIARELGLPRSTTYELLTELAAAGFAVHLPTERRWGLGLVAFEIGTAYLRGEPLERVGRPVLARLCNGTGGTAHLGVLHGMETLYLAKDKPIGTGPTLVTEVGVRLPAALTATGLSILAHLPPEQVRAVFPDRAAFVDRTGRGPATLPELRRDLADVRRRGWAVEDGRVSAGTASVAAPVFDHNGVPIAAVGVTIGHRCAATTSGPSTEAGLECGRDFAELAGPVRHAAGEVTAAIGGRAPV
jgi:DNA-binding IclR family transcriptional regulator